MAALEWNEWQLSSGFGGSFAPEYAGTGVWLCQRRLHQGTFVWPRMGDAVCAMTQAQWQWLVTGVDWQRLSAQPQADWQP